MEFVIWGAGVRGKRAADFLGNVKVKVFVDSNSSLSGQTYNGIPIVSIQEYLASYKDYFLIISIEKCEEILKILEEERVETYFIFEEDWPAEIRFGHIKSLEEIDWPEVDYDKAVVWGLSLYGILVWEYLLEKGKKARLIIDKDKGEQEKKLLKKAADSVLYQSEYILSNDDILLQVKRKRPEAAEDQIVDLLHLSDIMPRFHYPELRKFKNIHKGERCFVIGNGPSLRVEDLELLYEHGEVCFGVNGIPIIFDKTSWRPNYYFCPPFILEMYEGMISQIGLKNIFISDLPGGESIKEAKDHVNVFHSTGIKSSPEYPPRFSDDIVLGISAGTAPCVCFQVAIYMGFREIYLLGTDFNYEEDKPMKQMEHFDNKYLDGSANMTLKRGPDKTQHLLDFQATRKYADEHGIKIYNATRGGKLEVFERVDLDSLF